MTKPYDRQYLINLLAEMLGAGTRLRDMERAGYELNIGHNPIVKRIAPQPHQRVFYVGDVHGMQKMLVAELDNCGFRHGKDLLICTGDLVGRGPESLLSLELLKQNNIYSVLGNHEQLWAKFLLAPTEASITNVLTCGGAEIVEHMLSDNWHDIYTNTLQSIMRLPYAIEIQHAKLRIGVTHSEPLNCWSQYDLPFDEIQKTLNINLWERKRFASNPLPLPHHIANIDYVIAGHTILNEVTVRGNVIGIDTGAFSRGKLTVKTLSELL